MAKVKFVLRSTWNPWDPFSCCLCGASPSRRDMKRLSALNMVAACTAVAGCEASWETAVFEVDVASRKLELRWVSCPLLLVVTMASGPLAVLDMYTNRI